MSEPTKDEGRTALEIAEHAESDSISQLEYNIEEYGKRQFARGQAAEGETMATTKKKRVLIRSYGSGVHFGTLDSRKGTEVTLTNARRVWYWEGANTLHELSLHGAKTGSKISEQIPEITVTGVLEIIPLSKEAEAAFAVLGWA